MPYGPCYMCGATNYPMSLGGPYICPSCDCGNFNKTMGVLFSDQGGRIERRDRMTKWEEFDICPTCGISNSEVSILKSIKDRSDKAEDLLHRVLNHEKLSPGQWVSLILDIVEFKPKRKQ